MNKLVRGLLASLLAISAVNGAVKNDRTFIAHRDDLSNLGLEWTTKNHHLSKGNHSTLGATFMVTPFYATSTNDTDLGRLFGLGTTGKVAVSDGMSVVFNDEGLGAGKTHSVTPADPYAALYNFRIDHSPNSDGTTAGQIPMSGTVTLKPKRTVWGAHLSWDQSLDTVLKGLRFCVQAPITEVSTSMKATVIGTASAIPATDGKTGATLDEFFNGSLSKDIATYSNVYQKGLAKHKMDNKWHSAVGVGDVNVSLNWNCCNTKRFNFGVSTSLRIPTGNTPTGEWLFEPIYGARGHVAAGAGANVHVNGFNRGALHVGFDLAADWKYFFKGTEKRTLGVYDLTNKVTLPGSSWQNVMRHKQSGVQPSANVMTLDHTVTPGHQFEGLAGICSTWHNWTVDLGYNIFWHEKEKVVLKSTWYDDRYAMTHPKYSMLTTGDATEIPAEQHLHVIGTAGQDEGTSPDTDLYTSLGGPIQNNGKTTSALMVQERGTNSVTQDDADGGTQTVQYNTTSANAVTESQITHSIVGGIGYKFKGNYPVVVALGGQGEFQENDRNSALEGWKVWAKVGVNF